MRDLWIAIFPALTVWTLSRLQHVRAFAARRLRWRFEVATLVPLVGLLGCGGGNGGSSGSGGGGDPTTAPSGKVTPSGTYMVILTPVAVATGSPKQLQLNPLQLQLIR